MGSSCLRSFVLLIGEGNDKPVQMPKSMWLKFLEEKLAEGGPKAVTYRIKN